MDAGTETRKGYTVGEELARSSEWRRGGRRNWREEEESEEEKAVGGLGLEKVGGQGVDGGVERVACRRGTVSGKSKINAGGSSAWISLDNPLRQQLRRATGRRGRSQGSF
jgi:hypothetical protein